MEIEHFFDHDSHTYTYLVYDKDSKDAAVIDPTLHTPELETYIESKSLHLKYILETHIHADHISGAKSLLEFYPSAKIAIHENIEKVHNNFKEILGLREFSREKSGFDYFLKDKQLIPIGNTNFEVITTPGHTPACVCYLIDGNLFTGDALFMPDFGSGRCDFPGGSAKDLYHSIHEKLYKLPEDTKVFVAHDYGTSSREPHNQTTIGQSKKQNIQIGESFNEETFVTFRTNRDKDLAPPKNLKTHIKANLFAGQTA